jgi:hypothetical protein
MLGARCGNYVYAIAYCCDIQLRVAHAIDGILYNLGCQSKIRASAKVFATLSEPHSRACTHSKEVGTFMVFHRKPYAMPRKLLRDDQWERIKDSLPGVTSGAVVGIAADLMPR